MSKKKLSKKENLVGNTAKMISAIDLGRLLAIQLRKELDSKASVDHKEEHMQWFIRSGPFTKVTVAIGLLDQVENLLRSAQDDIRKI